VLPVSAPLTTSNLFETAGSTMDDNGLRGFLAGVEAVMMKQRSPQQPNPEVDRALLEVMRRYPEWRARMAVMTTSPWLRKKILALLPQGHRLVGSVTFGNSHSWHADRLRDVSIENESNGSFALRRSHLSRIPSEGVPLDPRLSRSQSFSVPRAKRFFEGGGNEFARAESLGGSPGPGAHFRTAPKGVAFAADGGETVVLGANHIFPWKGSLGHHINPVHCDHTTLPHAPAYSFAKMRRTTTDTAVGGGSMDGGPVKSDLGGISPGIVYQQYASFRPEVGHGTRRKPRSRSMSTLPRVRVVPVEPKARSLRIRSVG